MEACGLSCHGTCIVLGVLLHTVMVTKCPYTSHLFTAVAGVFVFQKLVPLHPAFLLLLHSATSSCRVWSHFGNLLACGVVVASSINGAPKRFWLKRPFARNLILCPMPLQLTMTDYKSPPPDSAAGTELALNMCRIRRLLQMPNLAVTQDVDVLTENEEQISILQRASMVVVGSPAPHGPDGSKEGSLHGHLTNAQFKAYVFYALTWRTPPDVTVAITWSMSACKTVYSWMESEPAQSEPGAQRTIQIWRARFNTYVPRRGLQDSLAKLSDEDDTMVALALPPCHLPKLVLLEDGVLDGSRTFAALAATGKCHLVAHAVYTAELELDIVNAYCTCATPTCAPPSTPGGDTAVAEAGSQKPEACGFKV